MRSASFLKPSGSGCTITIEASPSAAKAEIEGVNQWRGALRVRIAAPPREGAANEELIEFLASRLSIPKSSIKIVKGERSSRKIVHIPISAEKAKAILGEA